ncbi:MAG: hypothetical protein K6G81_01070 [Lachnospiraceae bacterium]|nr:hypothetical protein [Lachnospiraceae bacterium]
MELTGRYDPGTGLKYASIALCAFFAIINAIIQVCRVSGRNSSVNSADGSLLGKKLYHLPQPLIAGAMILTLLADTFLLLLDEHLSGVLCFIAVQTLYLWTVLTVSLRPQTASGQILKAFSVRLAARFIIAAIIYFAAARPAMGAGGLTAATSFYAVSFIDNILILSMALRSLAESYPHPALLLTGLILFALCDINVAFFNMSSYMEIQDGILSRLISFSDYLMWAFYLPGQVLIVLSCAGAASKKLDYDHQTTDIS